MTGITGFLPGPAVAPPGAGGAHTAAAGLPSGDAASAWRREMERQQQQAWFLPALPAPAALPWAVPPPSMQEAPAVSAPAAQDLPSADARCTAGAVAAPPTSAGHTHPQVAGGAAAFETASHPSMQGGSPQQQPSAEGEGGLRDAVSASVHGESMQRASACVLPQPPTPAQGAAAAVLRTEEVARAIHAVAAQLQGGVPLGALSLPTMNLVSQAQAVPAVPLTWVATPWAHAPSVPSESSEAEPASAASALPSAAREPLPPLRVHCDWQDGQMTVWIGHDRGHAASAAVLVQAIERWLTTQRLPAAGFVVNGEPREREATASGPADAPPTFTTLIHPPPHGVPDTALLPNHTLRENT